MGLALMKTAQPLRLHIRCENCLRESWKELESPPGEDLPGDPLELADGGYLNNIPFFCSHCESTIGKLFAVSGGSSYE